MPYLAISKPEAKFGLSLMNVKQSTNITAIERAYILHAEPLFLFMFTDGVGVG